MSEGNADQETVDVFHTAYNNNSWSLLKEVAMACGWYDGICGNCCLYSSGRVDYEEINYYA